MILRHIEEGAINPSSVDHIERMAQTDILFIKRLTSDLEIISNMSKTDEDAKNLLKELLEEVRLSDPRGVDESHFYEEMIGDAVKKLKDSDAVHRADIEPIVELLHARNSVIKAWK